MITQAEMVADTAKKHVAELKEMYAKGMDKKQSKKQNNKQSLQTKNNLNPKFKQASLLNIKTRP